MAQGDIYIMGGDYRTGYGLRDNGGPLTIIEKCDLRTQNDGAQYWGCNIIGSMDHARSGAQLTS